MNTSAYIIQLAEDLKVQIAAGGVPLSTATFELAISCDGMAYVYGAWGAECTPKERRKRQKYNPSATTITTKCQVLNGSRGSCSGCEWYPDDERTLCFDCRGFNKYIIEKITGFALYGDTVATQWGHADNWCAKGKVSDGIPAGVLVCLFKCKDGKWTHTGLYYNTETCETSSNVQYKKKMGTGWTHWAIAAPYAEEYNGQPVPEEPAKEDTVKTLRKGDKGKAVMDLQEKLLRLGYSLPKYGADGDFGKETEAAVKAFQKDHGLNVDGVAGPATLSALDAAIGSQPVEDLYTVTIPHQDKTQAEALCSAYPAATMTKEGGD